MLILFVVKIASEFYDNPKYGLPSSNGMMLAFSAATGTHHWVQPGTLIAAVGADRSGKQELPVELVQRVDHRVCDMAGQSLAYGEFQTHCGLQR